YESYGYPKANGRFTTTSISRRCCGECGCRAATGRRHPRGQVHDLVDALKLEQVLIMIVELFGPPCVGKTTVAVALAKRLGERGRRAHLILSRRPAEASQADSGLWAWLERRPFIAVLYRVARPIGEVLATAGHV